jgi:hypothetical protein
MRSPTVFTGEGWVSRAVFPEVYPELKDRLLLQASKVMASRFPKTHQC